MVSIRKPKKDLDVPVPPSNKRQPAIPVPTPINDTEFPPLPKPRPFEDDRIPLRRMPDLDMDMEDNMEDIDDIEEEEHELPTRQHELPAKHLPPTQITMPGISPGAPLFIKIGRYKEVVKDIQTLKSRALNLRDALDALSDMEKEIRKGLDLTTRILDGLNTTMAALDTKFLRFQGTVAAKSSKTAADVDKIDHYVKDLHNQMEKIKHEMRTVSV